jgi:lambda family phage portal protein
LVRNAPNIKGGVNSWVSNAVGTGITPHWQLDNKFQQEELQEAWEYSVPELDHHGTQDIYGVMAGVAEAEYVDGEVLAHFVDMPPGWVNPQTGLPLHVPLQVRLLESDHLDTGYNEVMANGDPVRYGIQWDKRTKKRKGYWISAEHPGETLWSDSLTHRYFVPVGNMSHIFYPGRPGQARGVTALSAAIQSCREQELAIHYELVRRKTQSTLSGAVYTDSGMVHPGQQVNAGGAAVGRQPVAVSGQKNVVVSPGTFTRLGKDERITFFSSPDVGSNYTDFLKFHDRRAAKSGRLTYEQLTGNLEGVSFSSIRFGLIEFRRSCEMWRRRTIVFQFCWPLACRWVRTGILNGAFRTITVAEYLANPRRFMQIDWRAPAWDSVDPLKDAMTDLLRMRSGSDSRPAVAAKRGRRYTEIDKENAEAGANARELGLVYDSDPSQVDKTGRAQDFEETALKAALESE